MFGLGWAEIMVAAVVGLIVIGPKELPVVFRKIGQFVGKAKGMARDFSRAMNDAADDSGMKDAMDSMHSLKDEVRSVTDPTTKWKNFAPGSETTKLAAERAEKSKKSHGATAVNPQGRLDAAKSNNTVLDTNSTPEKGKKLKAKNSVVKKLATTKAPAKPTLEKKTLVDQKKVATKKNALNKTTSNSGKTK